MTQALASYRPFLLTALCASVALHGALLWLLQSDQGLRYDVRADNTLHLSFANGDANGDTSLSAAASESRTSSQLKKTPVQQAPTEKALQGAAPESATLQSARHEPSNPAESELAEPEFGEPKILEKSQQIVTVVREEAPDDVREQKTLADSRQADEHVSSESDLTEIHTNARASQLDLTPAVSSPPGYRLGSTYAPKPEYPYLAYKRGWQGQVLLAVDVHVDGRAEKVEVLESSGFGLLDDAARSTVLTQWVFEPAMRFNQAVAGYTEVPIAFRIN